MDHRPPSSRSRRLRRLGIIAGVALAHVGVFAAIGLQQARVIDVPLIDPIEVELFRPFTPPPPPPPPEQPSVAEPGGGAPAAPSRVHVTPTPPERPPELPVAPPTPAPETSLVIGASPTASLNAGLGQGGQGTGTGSGTGDGDGPGSGTRPLILRGASSNDILAFVPPEARRQRRAGRAAVSCVVRADTRLEQCRVLEESPSGFGFGEAAVRVAEAHFRVRPGTTASGRVVEDGRMTVGVNFGRQ
ncbi:energy transducer TonB [Brevundimonas staleyi]|uniref:Energy transducer TonB n=1 Tax=Brevundimonas staleyi TaxID=74326 RepID=A0ABW0FWQ3_9CAUL